MKVWNMVSWILDPGLIHGLCARAVSACCMLQPTLQDISASKGYSKNPNALLPKCALVHGMYLFTGIMAYIELLYCYLHYISFVTSLLILLWVRCGFRCFWSSVTDCQQSHQNGKQRLPGRYHSRPYKLAGYQEGKWLGPVNCQTVSEPDSACSIPRARR
jgi:hypothetical protein